MIILGIIAMISIAPAVELEPGKTAYVIHDGQPLLAEKDPDSNKIDKLKTHHAYTIIQISGKWVQLKSDSASGWVYQGNLSAEEPPDVNNSVFSTQASVATNNAAARGLDDDAKVYADRKNEPEAANDVGWMENQNASITDDDVQAYMKGHKLGEYSGSK